MSPSAVHRVPVIERMMDVLDQLERARGQPTVKDLATSCGVPRSTVYRILNTLEAHRMVVRGDNKGGYQLGSRLLALAAHVPHGTEWRRLAEFAQPWLERLAAETGETAKLSVLEDMAALCVAVAPGPSTIALAALVGGRYPLHAGAASKVLLAAMVRPACEAFLATTLPRYTARTITDTRALGRELARVRRLGWAEDTGEHNLSVHAIAAPVRDGQGGVVAALSLAYLADRPAAVREAFRDAVCRTAAAIHPAR
jgi:DNA-binding IclR family transcriptional regulator